MRIQFPHVAAIVRTWGNQDNGTVMAVTRSLEAGVARVIVVVKAYNRKSDGENERWDGNVRSWLEELMTEHPDRIVIHEITDGPFNRSWSRELNAGVDIARAMSGITHVLAVSKEAYFVEDDLREIVDASSIHDYGVVMTTFQAQGVRLGITYDWGRNTLALWSLETLDTIGGFDEQLDGLHGMEDVLAKTLMLAMGVADCCLLDHLLIPLRVGENFDQIKKEAGERAGLLAGIESVCKRIDDWALRARFLYIARESLGLSLP